MKKEVQTRPLLEWCFGAGKRVFIPKVVGKRSADMIMPELKGLEELDSMEKSKWGIPEFTPEQLQGRADGRSGIVKDLPEVVIAPGMAFTRDGDRLGHGKGYYDSFLTELRQRRKEAGLEAPIIVGLSFEEQMRDKVPVEKHDVKLNAVVTPKESFFPKA